jgi:branched-chain amino acid transport system substrate-binding protein
MLGKAPGEATAWDLGFQVYSSLRYGTPEESKTACQGLATAGIDYAYLANTGESNARLIKTCRDMGVTTRFMTNVWGFDEQMLGALGAAADGVVWVMATAAWGEDVPGMALVKDIAAWAGHEGPQSIHYIQGVCAVYFMKAAMERASFMPGGETGSNIRSAMYEQSAWAPLGLEGVCNPGTWTPAGHGGIDTIWVYMAHVGDQGRSMERVYTASLPRAEPPAAPPETDH